MAASITQAGEIPPSQISKATTIGITNCLYESLIERAVVKQGTAIKATTAGRKPLKAFSIHSLSRTCVKNKAIAKMIRKEGSTVPK